MPITVLADLILPNSVISGGVRGRNDRLNSRVPLNNGYQSINVVWERTLREWEIGTVPMLVGAFEKIIAMHEITEGGAYGFLFEDPKDCEVTGGVFTALGGGVFQMCKRYLHEASGRYKDRVITRPKATNLTITRAGVPTAYTLDATTGRVTISGSPDVATLAWSGRFYVPVHFMEDSLDWSMVAPGAVSQRIVDAPSIPIQEIRE